MAKQFRIVCDVEADDRESAIEQVIERLNMGSDPDNVIERHDDDAEYIRRAKEEHEQEGTLEIDSDAVVSKSDDGGAYVQAWVWVYDEEENDASTAS